MFRCYQDDEFFYTGDHCEIQNPLLKRDDETLIIILCVLAALIAIAILICLWFCYQKSREGKIKIMMQEAPPIGVEGTYSKMEGWVF
jgi:flagellar basal body-associated protein FliL